MIYNFWWQPLKLICYLWMCNQINLFFAQNAQFACDEETLNAHCSIHFSQWPENADGFFPIKHTAAEFFFSSGEMPWRDFIVFCISICKNVQHTSRHVIFLASTFLRIVHAVDETLKYEKYEIMKRSANNRWWSFFVLRKKSTSMSFDLRIAGFLHSWLRCECSSSTSINRYFAINYSHFQKGKINLPALKSRIEFLTHTHTHALAQTNDLMIWNAFFAEWMWWAILQTIISIALKLIAS